MTTLTEVEQQSYLGTEVDLYTLDLSKVGGPVLYWTPSKPSSDKPIIWRGNTYDLVDLDVSGFAKSTSGTMPRPQILISNADNIIGAALTTYRDLLGCTITHVRTLYEFMDDQPGADDTQYWTNGTYYIERKISQNKNQVAIELATKTENSGIMFPRSVVIKQFCLFRYRRFLNGDFDYADVQCPYANDECFTKNGVATENQEEDVCGKRVSDCKLRFGDNAELPFGGFPGVARS